MAKEDDIINFLTEHNGEATLDEVSSALKIPKYGLNSAYALLYSLKSKNIVERRGDKWILIEQKQHHLISSPKPIEESLNAVAKTFKASLIQGKSEVSSTSLDLKVEVKPEEHLAPAGSHIIKPNKSYEMLKNLKSLESGTVLDMLFLGPDGEVLGGIPSSGQFVIIGPLGAGKSLILSEVALKVADSGLRVLYVSLDDFWSFESQRFDLQSRMFLRAEVLNLNWDKISENLYVLDQRLIDESFKENYKRLIGDEKIALVIFDSLDGLQSCMGETKAFHEILRDIIQTNKIYGVTGLFTAHSNLSHLYSRLTHETSNFPAHLMDGVIAVAYAQINVPGLKANIRGFMRLRVIWVLNCHICGFEESGILIGVTRDGLIQLIDL
jgi:KaiC/GvpD/RAD55 family RecA-like ATPase